MHSKNGKKLYNVRGITFFHETETFINDLNIYNRSKNGTNLWDDLIHQIFANTRTRYRKMNIISMTIVHAERYAYIYENDDI